MMRHAYSSSSSSSSSKRSSSSSSKSSSKSSSSKRSSSSSRSSSSRSSRSASSSSSAGEGRRACGVLRTWLRGTERRPVELAERADDAGLRGIVTPPDKNLGLIN
ncbi:MAG: hypothetical protein C4321_01425 [Chloroflexota bacterium]